MIDRRCESWSWRDVQVHDDDNNDDDDDDDNDDDDNDDDDDVQAAFSKIVAVFPGKIKEVFLLYKYPEGKRN